MKKLFFAAIISSFGLVACQREVDDVPEPPPPPVVPDNLAKKIVEIDENGDSAVAFFSYTPGGQFSTIDAAVYVNGSVTEVATGRFFYYSDGKMNNGWYRWSDSRGSDRTDYYCPKDAMGRLQGYREIDSAFGYVNYEKFTYDAKNRLHKIWVDIDSTKFFASAEPVNYRYMDSMVYDASDRVVSYHEMVYDFNPGSGIYEPSVRGAISNFDTHANYIPTGISSYIIFETEELLGGNNPGLVHLDFYHRGTPTSVHNISSIVEYDAQSRPTRIRYTDTNPTFTTWRGLFIRWVAERKMFY